MVVPAALMVPVLTVLDGANAMCQAFCIAATPFIANLAHVCNPLCCNFRPEMRIRSISPTSQALWLFATVSLVLFFVFGRWHRAKVIDGDVVSYYSYLPAVVIHGDITMRYSLGNDYYADKIWGVIWRDGVGPVQKYTMGLSWLYAPFFLLGHASAHVLGYAADGYTAPYKFWLQFSALAYLLLGMLALRRVLTRYFPEEVAALTLLILAFGTNLYYYTHGQAAMPHVYLFALVSGLLWLTIRFYASPTWKVALALGGACSLIAFIRPSHVLFWLIPVGYGISHRAALRDRLQFWRRHFPKFLAWPLLQALIVLPQLFYWKHLTTRWLYYSYGDESFFWAHPEVLRVMFSFRNGWLVYTPLLALGLAGLLLLRKHARAFAWAAPVVFGAGLYVVSCWWCWWYGGSFGQRVLIDFYPLLALGMGAMLAQLRRWLRTYASRVAGLVVISFFVALNVFQTFQYSRGVLHYDSMTACAYWSALGRDRLTPSITRCLQPPDYDAAKRGERNQ